MTEQFVPYELGVKLKELGFCQPCFCIWNREKSLRFNNLHNPNDRNKSGKLTNNNGKYPAPLWQQAFGWFREKHNIDGFIQVEPLNKKYGYVIYRRNNQNYNEVRRDKTYEEARLACLQELIKIVENDRR